MLQDKNSENMMFVSSPNGTRNHEGQRVRRVNEVEQDFDSVGCHLKWKGVALNRENRYHIVGELLSR